MLLRGRQWLVAASVALCVGLSSRPLPTAVMAQVRSDTDVKALMLRKLVSFIRWPDGRLGTEELLTVATLGTTPLGESLVRSHAASAGTLPGLRVAAARELSDLHGADIVFIASNQSARLQQVLRYCEARGALTVGDTEDFGRRGVAVNFFQDARRLRFEINIAALKRSGLRASYKVLSLARLVGDKP